MNQSYDLKKRELSFNRRTITLYYFSSLANDVLISLLVEGIENTKSKHLTDCFSNGDVETFDINDENQYMYGLMCGNSLIIDRNTAYVIDTKNFPSRSISEPETEKSVRGAKDGFNESILTNTGLLRRRLRDPSLTFLKETIGTKNKVDIAIVYIDSIVNKQLLDRVKKRVNDIRVEDLIMSDRALEELLIDQTFNPFPLVRYSERPDIVATHIQHGYIAIICDTSSSVMMLPTSLFEILEHVEEHRQTPLIGTFIKWIRLFAVALSLYLVPIYCLITHYLEWDYGFYCQVILVLLAIELLRIATIHTPESLSNAMGLVAAILLGQFAIDMGFFSAEILLVCSIGAVGGFATPNYELSLTNKYVCLFMVMTCMLFNIYGFILYNIILLIYLMNLKVFDMHYLYPLYPLSLSKLKRTLIRFPKRNEKNTND